MSNGSNATSSRNSAAERNVCHRDTYALQSHFAPNSGQFTPIRPHYPIKSTAKIRIIILLARLVLFECFFGLPTCLDGWMPNLLSNAQGTDSAKPCKVVITSLITLRLISPQRLHRTGKADQRTQLRDGATAGPCGMRGRMRGWSQKFWVRRGAAA